MMNFLKILNYFLHLQITLPVLGFALLMVNFSNEFKLLSYLCLVIILLFLYLKIYILLHEIGHVIAGKLCNVDIYSIQIGSGKKELEAKLFDIPISFHQWPSSGLTLASTTNYRNFKNRYTFFILGGILMTIILLSIQLTIYIIMNWEIKLIIYILPLSIYDLLMLFLNPIPRKVKISNILQNNDGANLITCFKDPEAIFKGMSTNSDIFKSMDLIHEKKYDEAISLIDSYLPNIPNPTPSLINKSICLIKLGRLSEYMIIMEELIGKNDNVFNYLVFNNYAWGLLCLNNSEDYPYIDHFTKEALRTDEPYIKGTRAVFLLLSGRTDEAFPLLKQIIKAEPANSDETLDHLCLANYYYQTGKGNKATRYYQSFSALKENLDIDHKMVANHLLKGFSESFILAATKNS